MIGLHFHQKQCLSQKHTHTHTAISHAWEECWLLLRSIVALGKTQLRLSRLLAGDRPGKRRNKNSNAMLLRLRYAEINSRQLKTWTLSHFLGANKSPNCFTTNMAQPPKNISPGTREVSSGAKTKPQSRSESFRTRSARPHTRSGSVWLEVPP